MVPLSLGFMREHPQVQLDLSFDDRYVNLVEQGIDVAIRMGQLADSTLGARYLGVNPWVMVASPDYLAQHGTPGAGRQELAQHAGADLQHACRATSAGASIGPDGRDRCTVPVHGPLRSNNLSAVLAAARAGMGLAALPWYVAHAIGQGRIGAAGVDSMDPAVAGDPRRVSVAAAGAAPR